jgi:tetratricopeptide (TPR) repeat protein
MNSFNIDDIISEDETLHLDIRNIENNQSDYKAWMKFAKDLLERGNYYKFLYEKSKSEYAKSNFESMYDKSLVCSEKSIELNPRNIDSWYNKGIALSNLGEFEKAIQSYDRVIEIDPNYFPVWNTKGIALSNLGEFEKAIQSYDRVIEKNANHPTIWYNKGIALSNLRKFEEAIKCYDRVIEIDPKIIDALNAKGYALVRVGKNEEALMIFDTVIEIDPHNIEALLTKGYTLERIGKYYEAEQYYSRVSEEYTNEINVMNEKAKEYQKIKKYDEAIICYDRVISIDANNSTAWLDKGLILYNLNKYEEAIECYDRVIGLDKYKEKLKKEGQVLTDKQVIEYYKAIIKPNPKNIEALNAKGYALEKLGKYDDAIQIFDSVIVRNPPFVIETIIKNGDVFMNLGNYSAAEKSYNDALKHDQNNISALNKLHALYSNYTFQYEKAISVTEQLLKGLTDQEVKIDTKLLFVQDLINIGNYKQGRKIAKETIKEIPNEFIKRQLIIRFLIIVLYLLEEKKSDGIEELEKFLVYYGSIDIDHFKIEENQWNFKGLVNSIQKNIQINQSTKTILRNLIDLLHGYTNNYKILLHMISLNK